MEHKDLLCSALGLHQWVVSRRKFH